MTDTFTLPPVEDERVSALETRIFHSIAASRAVRAARRRRITTVGGVAAGLLVVAVVIGPALSSGGPGFSSSADSVAVAPESVTGESAGGSASGSESSGGDAAAFAGGGSAVRADGSTGREIVSSASATLRVASVQDVIGSLSARAAELGGYVESSTTTDATSTSGSATGSGAASGITGSDTTDFAPVDPSLYQPLPEGAGLITVRIPADRLAEARDGLSTLGTVTSSSVNRQDVTTQAIDLRTRVDSAQASVDRLTELITQAGSLTDLLAAESALAERQASLESYQQQLTALEDQVSLASLSVTVIPESSPTVAEPTGFLDGLLAGWNGLVATANGALIGIGFLLPWLVALGVVALVVILIRRRRPPRSASPPAPSVGEE